MLTFIVLHGVVFSTWQEVIPLYLLLAANPDLLSLPISLMVFRWMIIFKYFISMFNFIVPKFPQLNRKLNALPIAIISMLPRLIHHDHISEKVSRKVMDITKVMDECD